MYMRSLFGLIALLLLVGAGCDPVRILSGVPANTTSTTAVIEETGVVARSFTFDELEEKIEGGSRAWLSSLIGKPTRVRLPIVSVYAFGCTTATQYCVSTFTGGCYGPFVELKGKTASIDALRARCEQVCDEAGFDAGLDGPCTPEFVASNCSVLLDVEGTVSAVGKPNAKAVKEQCTADEPVYTITVDRVQGPLDTGRNEEFVLREYR